VIWQLDWVIERFGNLFGNWVIEPVPPITQLRISQMQLPNRQWPNAITQLLNYSITQLPDARRGAPRQR
jgi:hypothetical protein